MKTPNKISSITALHNLFNLQKPLHPLISVFDITDIAMIPDALRNAIYTDFYVIALKRDCGGKCRYGQQFYDFEEGIMFFIAPNQVFQLEDVVLSQVKGSVLIVHPDFLQGYQLAAMVKNYGYFSYSINEALHLSEQEEKMIKEIMDNIKHETEMNIDAFTQDLLVSNIDLLLKYCDRFYNRQFLTRKKVNNDLLGKLEVLLDDCFRNDKLAMEGIPTVQFIAQELNLSPNYLSDMLRTYTGRTTQQHIQDRLIEKAKVLLSTTGLSVSEIAYQLGFEHPQSFHRLFKNQTSVSPVEFRKSFE
jgi:AraC family transcriptional activator of pobA